MDDRMDAVKAELEAVSFVGETLAPFFLQDPRTGTAGAAFQAVAQLRAQEAADAWPFAGGAEARHALSLMVNGLADGIDADDLVWEYRRLFVGPAPKPAPPWGSVYTDRECVVFGEGTLELRAWMRAHAGPAVGVGVHRRGLGGVGGGHVGAAGGSARARREAHDR